MKSDCARETNSSDWLLEIFMDLKTFCDLNHLPRTAQKIAELCVVLGCEGSANLIDTRPTSEVAQRS